MKTKRVNQDKIYAKLLALSVIYEKDEGSRKALLEKVTYTHCEINAILDEAGDCEFRSWVEASIPMMQYRKRE